MIEKYTYRYTDQWKGFMKYAVQMVSATQKLVTGIHRLYLQGTLIFFFQNKDSRIQIAKQVDTGVFSA
jgi:hypothetical protein